ncbi:MAG: tRNA (N6-threonylcarbamoyladenosine(37)-N6)-methyltransferase TrmO [Synergistales bacterium]|jgi:tRNA-Thr(GGU) m(6)t(6)A37 methyltransferase TsaA|nr:tRNA (N6-threonylcarbamoyladenosine(37)-N6)-methyltransferase TrmO [Synergistales bacterium]
MNGYALHPVGFVRSRINRPVPPDDFRGIRSTIEILPEFEEALEGLEGEDHILVLFRFHLSKGFSLKVHPRGDLNRPLRGVFSTCSPDRPNHIGTSLVRLSKVEGATLTVEDLDAVDGTPVIDIKPFKGIDRRSKEQQNSQGERDS